MLLTCLVAATKQLKILTMTSLTIPTFQLHIIDQDEIKIIQNFIMET